jgi:hypothetical protein
MRGQSRQLKPSFNKSGQNSRSRLEKALAATEVASETAGPRHGSRHVRISRLPGRRTRSRARSACRHQRILAPVLRQGIRPLPAGTALYARAWPRLARQALGIVTPAFHLTTRIPPEHDRHLRPACPFAARALVRTKIARDHMVVPDGRPAAVIIAMNGPPHDAAALCHSR